MTKCKPIKKIKGTMYYHVAMRSPAFYREWALRTALWKQLKQENRLWLCEKK